MLLKRFLISITAAFLLAGILAACGGAPEQGQEPLPEAPAAEEEAEIEVDEAEPEAEEVSEGDLEAIGSEEDGGGSPFEPGSGPKTAPTRTTSDTWEGDAAGLTAFVWHREGGIAGFCEDVTVYTSGEVVVNTCRREAPEELGRFQLNEEQSAAVQTWLETLAPFEEIQADPPEIADGMTVELYFYGEGNAAAAAADKRAIGNLAGELAVQAMTTPTPEP